MGAIIRENHAVRNRRGTGHRDRVARVLERIHASLGDPGAGWAFEALEAGRELMPFLERRRTSDLGHAVARARGLQSGWRALSYRLVDLIAREGPAREPAEHERLKQEVRAWIGTAEIHFREFFGGRPRA